MAVIGLVVLGIVLGAAGMETLRATNGELMDSMENRVKRFLDGLGLSKSPDDGDQ